MDQFVIDTSVGRNITFQLDFDQSECSANLGLIAGVLVYNETGDAILWFDSAIDNENDNEKVDVFMFTEPEMTVCTG